MRTDVGALANAHVHANVCASMCAYAHAFMRACMHACRHACLLACLLACFGMCSPTQHISVYCLRMSLSVYLYLCPCGQAYCAPFVGDCPVPLFLWDAPSLCARDIGLQQLGRCVYCSLLFVTKACVGDMDRHVCSATLHTRATYFRATEI